MGSIIYSHLNNSLLLDKSLIAAEFHGVSEQELEDALKDYRDFCIKNFNELLEELSPEAKQTRLYVGKNVDSRLLKQGAFYLDTVIISDPLIELTRPDDGYSRAWSHMLKIPAPERIDRKKITDATKTLLSHRGLVANDYVRFFPTSLENEPTNKLPLILPEKDLEGVLPPDLLELYKKAARVRSIKASDQGLLIMRDLIVSRMISVSFDGNENGTSYGYNLVQNEVMSVNKDSRQVTMRMHMPENLPTKEMFDAWVSQSINSSARKHFEMLLGDIRWSTRFGSQYMTSSDFTASILDSKTGSTRNDIKTSTSNSLLNLNLPIFEGTSMDRLMSARSDEEAFRRFRMQLEKHFREIRLETDPVKRIQKTENAMHELTEIQLTEVDSAIRRLKRKGLLSGAGTIASLAAATVTSGASLIATLVAAYTGYKTYEEYRISAKENPAYFLWQALGRK